MVDVKVTTFQGKYTFENDGFITGTARIYGWDARSPRNEGKYQPTTDYQPATGSIILYNADGTVKKVIESGTFNQAPYYYPGTFFKLNVSAGDYIDGNATFAGVCPSDWYVTSTSASWYIENGTYTSIVMK